MSTDLEKIFAEVLSEAEKRYGLRDASWKILPILAQGQNFPETIANRIAKTVIVRVTVSTLQLPLQARSQLAHECVHVVASGFRRDTIWFEEGLANEFSLTLPSLTADYHAKNEEMLPELFRGPLAAIRALKPSDESIRALRSECPLDEITPELIKKHFGADDDLANRLCQRLGHERPAVM